VAEGQVRRLGFISFRPLPGKADYYLYFRAASHESALRARPDPSVRPWWIEAVRDPDFEVDVNRDGKPDFYSWYTKPRRPDSWRIVPRQGRPGRHCLQLSNPTGGTVRSLPDRVPLDKRAAGRRLVFYLQLYSRDGLAGRNIGLNLRTAPPKNYATIVNWYFGGVPAGAWYATSIAGRVPEGMPIRHGRLWCVFNGPCRVGEFHVQLPPEPAALNRIGVDTDVALCDDQVGVSWQSMGKACLFALPVAVETRDGRRRFVQGNRVDAWPEGFRLEARIEPAGGGKPVATLSDIASSGQSWRGTLKLDRVPPGRYHVLFEVKSKRRLVETVARLERELRVLRGPFANDKGAGQ